MFAETVEKILRTKLPNEKKGPSAFGQGWIQFKYFVQRGYHTFCDGTSLHGFTQLYYAKSIFWSLFWIICITISLVMTVYQVYIAIGEYMDQGSMTVIRIATEEEILYPPLKLCHTHWLQWINFDKAYSLNFTKESVLYGLSFLTSIYALDNFNVSDAKESFTESMKANGLTKMTDFYKFVSKFAPVRKWDEEFFGDQNYSRYGGPYLNHFEFVMYQQGNLLFCHVQTGEEVKAYIKETKSKADNPTNANVLTFALNEQHTVKKGTSTIREIDSREYNIYVAAWIENMTPQYWINDDQENFEKVKQNYTNFDSPLVLFPNGYSKAGVKIAPDIDEYFITIRASAHKWKNTKSYTCDVNSASVASDSSCSQKCIDEIKYRPGKKYSFDQVYNLGHDEPGKLLENNIIFIVNETDYNETAASTINPTTNSPQTEQSITTFAAQTTTAKVSSKNCTEKCVQGCTRWNFDVSVTSGSIYNSVKDLAEKRRTNFQIDYPVDGDILVMVETDSQTWENFVGSVGGLLGIWTGASLLSFCQMFYLCCYADSYGPCDCLIPTQSKQIEVDMKKRRRRKTEGKILVPVKRIKTISSEVLLKDSSN